MPYTVELQKGGEPGSSSKKIRTSNTLVPAGGIKTSFSGSMGFIRRRWEREDAISVCTLTRLGIHISAPIAFAPSVFMEDPSFVPYVRPKRILVIGGGASGLGPRNAAKSPRAGCLDEGVSGLNARAVSSALRWPSPAYPGLIRNVRVATSSSSP
ncbi:hypothetical protein B0H11DRAFT_1924069 [Mycena galericulata]|nr:hypothetical protein B0H11DRAFT_1924069 [Mycena galericulata]